MPKVRGTVVAFVSPT